MKKLGIILFIFSSLAYSCNKGDDTNKKNQENEPKIISDYLTANGISDPPKASGLYVTNLISGYGPAVAEGDYVLADFNAYTAANKTVVETSDSASAFNTYNIYPVSVFNQPVMLWTKDSILLPKGLREGLTYLNEGGSARLILPSKLAWGSYSNSIMPSYSPIVFEIQVLKVIKNPVTWDSTKMNKWLRDSLQLSPADSTASGIYIKYYNKGDGDLATDGNFLIFNTTTRLMNGYYLVGSKTQFFTGATATVGYNTFTDNGCWDKILRSMRKNTRAKVVVPYYYAYGKGNVYDKNTGQILVPYYSSLVIDIVVTGFN